MATLISTATGNFTDAATWALCDAATILDEEAGTGVVSTVNQDSTTFTPGAITVDGIALKIASVITPTGTFTGTLRNSTGGVDVASVTVNASDLPTVGWFFLKFSAPQLLLDATSYLVRVVRSVADSGSNRITLSTSTGSIRSRMLRTTTTQAPGAGDKLLILGAMTGVGTDEDIIVTLDNTATTSFGNSSTTIPSFVVGKRGTLTLATAGSTNYYLKLAALFAIYSGGTVNFGTSGTPLPSTSTFVLEWNCAAAGDFGLRVFDGGTLNMYGATKTAVWNYLTVDKAAAATTLTVVDTTGWAAGDELCIASTTRTYSQCEKKTIQTVDSGTTVTLTAGLTNAHSGTSPTQAEVGNLTRNIKLRGISVTLVGYLRFDAASVVTARYVEVYWNGCSVGGKEGLFVATTTGTFDWQYGTVHDCTVTSAMGFYVTATSGTGVTIASNVTYNVTGRHVYWPNSSTGTWVMQNNLWMLSGTGGTLALLQDVGGTYQDNHHVGSGQYGLQMNEANSLGTWSGNVVHSCAIYGVYFNTFGGYNNTRMETFSIWRCSSYGILIGAYIADLTLASCIFFGNNTANLYNQNYACVLTVENSTFAGDTTFATSYGIQVGPGGRFLLRQCTLGVASGIQTTHSLADVTYGTSGGNIVAWNTRLASANEVYAFGLPGTNDASLISEDHDQIPGTLKNWYRYGTVQSDTVLYSTAAPSLRLTPNSATSPLSYKVCTAAIATGTTATLSVKVRCSVSGDGAAYNGGFPRLIVKRNDSLGITSDTVLDTATSASSGAWETLTGTTSTVTGNGVLEYIIDCTGTTGWINCDDVTPPTAVDTTGFLYGLNGERGALVGTTAAGGLPGITIGSSLIRGV